MTQHESNWADDTIRRIERRAHFRRVRTVVGLLALGAMSMWCVVEVVVWILTAVLA